MSQPVPPTPGVPPAPEKAKLGLGAIASISGLVLLLLVILQNRTDVTFKFLLWNFTWPLWIYTIVVAVFGAFVWIGIGVMRRRQRRKERRSDY